MFDIGTWARRYKPEPPIWDSINRDEEGRSDHDSVTLDPSLVGRVAAH